MLSELFMFNASKQTSPLSLATFFKACSLLHSNADDRLLGIEQFVLKILQLLSVECKMGQRQNRFPSFFADIVWNNVVHD
jgi:hypothetical protein